MPFAFPLFGSTTVANFYVQTSTTCITIGRTISRATPKSFAFDIVIGLIECNWRQFDSLDELIDLVRFDLRLIPMRPTAFQHETHESGDMYGQPVR